MHPAIEKVARDIYEQYGTDEIVPWERLRGTAKSYAFDDARAAIRSFIEYARDNVSDVAVDAIHDEFGVFGGMPWAMPRDTFRAMLTALLNEIEEQA